MRICRYLAVQLAVLILIGCGGSVTGLIHSQYAQAHVSVEVVSRGDGQVVLSWTGPPMVTTATVFHSSDGTDPDRTNPTVGPVTEKEITVDGLINGRVHRFQLGFATDTGEVIYSDIVPALPVSNLTLAPNVSSVDAGVDLHWFPVTGVSYDVLRSTSREGPFDFLSRGTTQPTYRDDAPAAAGHWYQIQVSDEPETRSMPVWASPGIFGLTRLSSLAPRDFTAGVQVVGDLAYLADAESGLRVVDVSDRSNPVELGVIDTAVHAQRVDVEGSRAAVADFDGGAVLVDVSNPSQLEILDIVPSADWVSGVDLRDPYLFIADGNAGLRIAEIDSAGQMTVVDTVSGIGSADEVVVIGDYAFVTTNSDGIIVVDVSTIGSATAVHSVDPGSPLAASAATTDLLLAVGFPDLLHVFDISPPESATLLTSYSMAGKSGKEVSIYGNLAHVAVGTDGVLLIDISTPSSPAVVGSVATDDICKGVAFDGEFLYSASTSAGLMISYGAVVLGPQIVSSVPAINCEDIDISGDRLLAAESSAGDEAIVVVDISEPADMQILDSRPRATSPEDIHSQGSMWHVASSGAPLQVLNEDLGFEPSATLSVADYNPLSVTAYGEWAFVSAGTDGVITGRPGRAAEDQSVVATASARDVFVSGQYAVVADGHAGLLVFELGAPGSEPILRGSVVMPTGKQARDVTVRDQVAFVAADNDGLVVVDIANPDSPVIRGSVPGLLAYAVDVSGSVAAVADPTSGVVMVDVSNPMSPSVLHTAVTPDFPFDVRIDGHHVYVADIHGVLCLDLLGQ